MIIIYLDVHMIIVGTKSGTDYGAGGTGGTGGSSSFPLLQVCTRCLTVFDALTTAISSTAAAFELYIL